MNGILNAFPTRPLRVAKSGIGSPMGNVVLALVMFALLLGGAIWVGPNLVRDFIIQADPVEVPEADIRNGECSTYRGIVESCGADIAYEIKGKQVQASLHYLFLDPSNGDYQVSVVRSASHPSMATLSLGLDMLWNRAIVAAAVGLGLLAAGLALLTKASRGARFERSLKEPMQLVPLAATVSMARKLFFGLFGTSYAVKYSVDGKKYTNAHTTFRGKSRPFVLGYAGKKTVLLGVVPRQGGMLILLDAALTRMDFTDAEREAIGGAMAALGA
ncbi:MAG: rane protein [Devosia sp.]|uniref:hypothetical protein n=1 Tax=Devosia sp. TaxID=1871048 RepID=UPI002628AF36|nr:hypothetical protein [Devosia sp.]MDB5531266.1 rane protein [Devosia sp.]